MRIISITVQFHRLRHAVRIAPACAILTTVLLFAGCGDRPPSKNPKTVAQAVQQTSPSCRSCHEEIFAAWAPTDHARANRPFHSVHDRDLLAAFASAAPEAAAPPDMLLGHLPFGQPLVPAPGNRWQAHELAFDPAHRDWFNVFGNEARHAGEWGHWTGRAMNWNSMCAHCHMTGYQKNYDTATDAYRSTWVEHGIGCIQCHGPVSEKHLARDFTAPRPAPPFHGDRTRMMQTCAPCHARNEQLTLDFQPGDDYHDHYRATLPVDPATFYPDGQQLDEVFNWTSVLQSRMAHAGVTCLDCHDPHSTRTLLPASNNALCLQCHSAPGRVQPNGVRATPIDPLAHSHHQEGSTGNSCVACHMPTTTYMQRAPRHDHGWLKPDPLLTKELGIPNACSTCHTDKTVDWAIEHADAWYGPKLDSRQRRRARTIAAAQSGRADAVEGLLAMLATEDIPLWRATYLTLLAPYADDERTMLAAKASLAAPDPMERSAAVKFFTPHDDARAWLRPLLDDPSRLVRLDAAWALSAELPEGSAARKELDAYLKRSSDQPAGRLRQGMDLANRGRLIEAEVEMRVAAEWDPYSSVIREEIGLLFVSQGRPQLAAVEFSEAAKLDPRNASAPYRAALVHAETGNLPAAEASLRTAIERDPAFARAHYNLGLLLAQAERLGEASTALREAERLAPQSADFAYALATVLLRTDDRTGAHAAAERALQSDPNHAGARQIVRQTRP